MATDVRLKGENGPRNHWRIKTEARRHRSSHSARNLVHQIFYGGQRRKFRSEAGVIFGLPQWQRKNYDHQMLTGLLPLSGKAIVEGLKVRSDAERVRERIGYVQIGLYPDLPLLKYFYDIYSRGGAKTRMDEVIVLNDWNRI